jgi:mycothiol conjugate amidase Mca
VPEPLTLMTVHAHPDDETISTGGVMARYASEGLRVVCVTCTGGEEGEIVVPDLDTPENHARLAEIRAVELERALAHLGPIEHHWLGYRDSGMMGTPENEHPDSLWQADRDEATGRLVQLVRLVRPQVIVSYNDYGGYGHPDHIGAARTAKAAFERAGDPEAYPEQLGDGVTPWESLKLYETVLDMSRRQEMVDLLKERGVSTRWLGSDDESDEEREQREGWLRAMAEAQGPVTTRVDVRDWLAAKDRAMREHVTQFAPDSWFFALTAEERVRFQPTEDFTLVVSRVGVRLPESDLFAGLREEAALAVP